MALNSSTLFVSQDLRRCTFLLPPLRSANAPLALRLDFLISMGSAADGTANQLSDTDEPAATRLKERPLERWFHR
jgi:hypothetical protein